jgi:diguanylate cyclase (GGDEF)-like protein
VSTLRDIWQPVQDGLARLSGLRLELLAESGEPWATPSGAVPPPLERAESRGLAARERAAAVARLRGEPVSYVAPTGLQAFVAPIETREGRLLLVGGHAFATSPDEGHRERLARELSLDAAGLEALLAAVPVIAPPAFRSLVQVLDRVARSVLAGLGEAARSPQQVDRAAALLALVPDLAEARLRSDNGHAVTGVGDPAGAEGLVLHALAVLFEVPAAALLHREADEEAYRAVAAYGMKGLELTGLMLRADTAGPLGRALSVPGGPTRPVETREVYELLKAGFPEQAHVVQAFPLAAGGRWLLVVVNAELTSDEVALIATFARQAGVAIEARRLRRLLEQRERDIETLAEVGGAVSAALDSEELFRVILERASGMVEANLGSLMLLDEGRGDLVIKATKGLHEKIVEQFRIRLGEGIAGTVAATGRPILVRDIEADARVARRNRPRFQTRSFVSLPLALKGRTVGVLNLADKRGGGPFGDTDLTLLMALAAQAAVAIERSAFYERSEALKQISITDGLTGLLNRHYFEERLTEELDRASRTRSHVSFVMIDIDGFKAFNDTHGHLAGDGALRLTAATIRGTVRTMDIVARYGGEEFAVILPETGRVEASAIAERIRREVEGLAHNVEGEPARLTISAGVAEYPDDASNLRELITRADKALYAAKAAGKNRVVISSAR